MSENYKDSNGMPLAVGDIVHIELSLAETQYDFANGIVTKGRDFDFGTVEGFNDDGTVKVFWNGAGCSCNSPDGRPEVASELTKADEHAATIFNLAENKGWDKGRKATQEDLRDVLGISDNDAELKSLQERLEALEAKNN